MRLKIGIVLKPQGIKGEIKVKSFFDTAESYKSIKKVQIKGASYDVSHLRIAGEYVFLTLKCIDSIEKAEVLRNSYVEIDRDDAPKLAADRYYIEDLIGKEIEVDGRVVGILDEVLQYGAADVYCVKGDRKFSFPALKVVILSVGERIVLDPTELNKVILYED